MGWQTMADDGRFSPKRQALIEAYAVPPYPPLRTAAKTAGISERTAYRWWQDEAFRGACLVARTANQEAVRASIKDQMHAVLPEIFEIKIDLARHGVAKVDEVRDSASTWILEYALGKAPQRNEVTGKDGGPIATRAEVVIMLPQKQQPPDPGEAPHGDQAATGAADPVP